MKKYFVAFVLLFSAALAGAQQTQIDPARIGWGVNPAGTAAAPFISPTKTAAQTMAGPLDGIWPSSAFGVKCDGATDDTTALNSIGTFASTLLAGNTITVNFPSNAVCVHASSITTWFEPNLHIQGHGSRLKFTGSGKQIYLHNATLGEIDNFWLEGFVLQGNSASTDGVYQDTGTWARGRLDLINVQDHSNSCYTLGDYQLNERTNLICSAIKASTMGVIQTTEPSYGVVAGGTGYFANNRVVNLTIESTLLIGLECVVCTNSNHFYGTVEHGAGVGITDVGGVSNIFTLDLESNAVADANISGQKEMFEGTYSLGTFNILGGGSFSTGTLDGGIYQSIVMQSGHNAWNLKGLFYNNSQTSGTVTGYTPLDCLINVQNRSPGFANITSCLGVTNSGAVIGSSATGGTLRVVGLSGASYDYTLSTAVGGELQILSSKSGAIPLIMDSLGDIGVGTNIVFPNTVGAYFGSASGSPVLVSGTPGPGKTIDGGAGVWTAYSTVPGAWTQTTPTATCQTGALTSSSTTLRVSQQGKTASFTANITLVPGTCATGLVVPLPFTPELHGVAACTNFTAGAVASGQVQGTSLYIYNATGYAPIVGTSSQEIDCTGTVETQ